MTASWRCRSSGFIFRRLVSQTRLESAHGVSGEVFSRSPELYAVLVAFVVVVVWEQFGDAEKATQSKASAIATCSGLGASVPTAEQYRMP